MFKALLIIINRDDQGLPVMLAGQNTNKSIKMDFPIRFTNDKPDDPMYIKNFIPRIWQSDIVAVDILEG